MKNGKKKKLLLTSGKRIGYSISALPYRLSVMMPLTVSETKKPYKLMGKHEFVMSGCGCACLRDLLVGFLQNSSDVRINTEDLSGMRISKEDLDFSNPNELRCVIWAGRYGFESELYDIKTKHSQKKSRNKCDMVPLHCRIIFKEDHLACLVIFEKFGPYSCVGPFMRSLGEYVRSLFKDPDYKIQYGQIVNIDYALRSFNSSIKALHLIRYKKACEVEDCLDYENDTDEIVKIDVRLSMSGRGRFLKLLNKLHVFGTDDKFSGVMVDGEKYTEVEVELLSGNRRQKVVAGRNMLAVPFDITNMVTCDISTGHPSMSSFVSGTEECLQLSSKVLYGEDRV